MVNYKEILRLSHEGYSQRQLESSLHCSRHTIRDVLTVAKANGITYPLDDSLSNEQLEAILFPEKRSAVEQFLIPDFAYIHKELVHCNNIILHKSFICGIIVLSQDKEIYYADHKIYY